MSEIDQVKQFAKNSSSVVGNYQAKMLEIAQENMKFAFEYGQAIASVKSPADFMSISTEYGQKRIEMFQRHTQELMGLAKKINS